MDAVLLLRYGACLLAWVVVCFKLLVLYRHAREPAAWGYWSCFAILALVLTVTLPSVSAVINRRAEIPSLTWLLADGLSLVGWWCLLAYLYHLGAPGARGRKFRRPTAGAVLCAVVVMAALFAVTPLDSTAAVRQRDEDATPMLLYHLIYLGLVGLLAVQATRPLRRYAAIVTEARLRAQLGLYTLGPYFGLGYVCAESVRAAVLKSGAPVPLAYLEFTTMSVVFLAVLSVTTAITMPLWGRWPGLRHAVRWLDDFFIYRLLYCLWRDLYRAHPEIAYLEPPRSAIEDILSLRRLRLRLYRRVIELRDGIVRLRPYHLAEAEAYARRLCQMSSLSRDETAAIVAATSIAVALRGRARGERSPVPATPWGIAGGADLATEIAALVRVAYHYRHSPIVAAVVQRIERERSSPGSGPPAQARRAVAPTR